MALSTREMLLILRARDELSRVLRGVATGFGDVDAAALRAARNQMTAGSALIGLGVGIASAGVAVLNTLYDWTTGAAEFEHQVAKVRTQIDAGVKPSLEALGSVSKRVAREVAVPLEQMNETLFFIFSSMDVNITEAEALLKGFAKEAVAGQTDIQSAAKLTISILNTFQLPVSELGRIQDVMFQIVRKGIISYEELSNTIGRALPATRRAGQEFEQLGGMIAFLTKNGLSAAMAATSAARAMEAFAHPKTVERMEKMGITVKDAAGNFRPMNDVITELGKKLEGLPQPEKVGILQDLFKSSGGTIQARRFFDVVLSGNKQLAEYNQLVGQMVDSTGVFEEAYGEMSNTTVSQTQILKNQWELIKLEIGQALLPVLQVLIGWLQKLLGVWDTLSPATKETIAHFAAIAGVVLAVSGAIMAGVGVFLLVKGALAALGIVFGVLSVKILIIIAVIGIIVAAFVRAWNTSEKFREGVRALGAYFASFWPQIVALFEKFKAVAGPALDKIVQVLSERLIPALLKFFETIKPVLVWLIDIIGGALIGAFHGLMVIIEGAFTFISGLLNFFSALFKGDWGALWEAVKEMASGIWTIITGLFEYFWNVGILKLLGFGASLIKGLFTGLWSWIRGIFTSGWQGLSSIVSGGINAVVQFFASLPGRAMGAIRGLWDEMVGFFWRIVYGVRDAVVNGFNSIISWFGGIGSRILGALGNFGDLLRQAGRNLIDGLWRGIESMWGTVKAKLVDIANQIRGLWPFSPAKWGPLKTNPMDEAGMNLMKFLGDGINKGIPSVMNEMYRAADAVANTQFTGNLQGRTAMGIPTAALTASGGGGAGVVQYVTVYTNEIDPRRNAAELGWALGQEVS